MTKEDSLQTLRRLQTQLASAVACAEANSFVPMSDKEMNDYLHKYGTVDFVVGDFMITEISK